MADVYASSGLGPREAFVAAVARRLAHPRSRRRRRPISRAICFPDTYPVPRQTPAATLVAQMVRGFRAALTPELIARAAADGLSVRQVVTLAALVEKETAQDAERPIVAAVYRNRHRIGMGDAGRPHRDLRACRRRGSGTATCRATTCSSIRPTTPIATAACRRGRSRRRGNGRSRRWSHRRRWTTCTSSAATTARTCSRRRCAEHNRNVFEWQVKFFRDRRAARARRGRRTASRQAPGAATLRGHIGSGRPRQIHAM